MINHTAQILTVILVLFLFYDQEDGKFKNNIDTLWGCDNLIIFTQHWSYCTDSLQGGGSLVKSLTKVFLLFLRTLSYPLLFFFFSSLNLAKLLPYTTLIMIPPSITPSNFITANPHSLSPHCDVAATSPNSDVILIYKLSREN